MGIGMPLIWGMESKSTPQECFCFKDFFLTKFVKMNLELSLCKEKKIQILNLFLNYYLKISYLLINLNCTSDRIKERIIFFNLGIVYD